MAEQVIRCGAGLDGSDVHAPVVRLYVDPSCPFAWLASRWLLQVEAHLSIDLSLHVMSLALLDRHDRPRRGQNDAAARLWVYARACVAVGRDHGQSALRRLYAELGHRRHVDGIRDVAVLATALEAAGLPSQCWDDAWTDRDDDLLSAEHGAAIALLGEAAASPALHIDGAAVAGPVLTGVPKGADAVAVFASIQTLLSCPHWSEIKRDKSEVLTYD